MVIKNGSAYFIINYSQEILKHFTMRAAFSVLNKKRLFRQSFLPSKILHFEEVNFVLVV